MKKNLGMTLVEVVVAMAIFVILVAMIFPIITNTGLMNLGARRRLEAQETGSKVAEVLLYESRSKYSKSELQDLLTTSGLDGFSIFTLETEDVYTTSLNNNHIRVEFDDTRDLVRIIVTNKKVVYETLEWMLYDE